jgi:hypothetical protein
MMRKWTWLPLSLLCATWLGGCFPDELPAYVDGGQTVVIIAADSNRQQTLWTYDVATGRVAPHPTPEGSQLVRARAIGGQVWVELRFTSDANSTEAPSKAKVECRRFDAPSNEYQAEPEDLQGSDWLSVVIPITHDGKKCLAREEKKGTYRLYSLPDLEKGDTVELNEPKAAGRWWWIQTKERTTDSQAAGVESIDVFRPASNRACAITPEEANKAGGVQRAPFFARVTEDGKSILLAWAAQGLYEFGIFDTQTGRFRWGGKGTSLVGVPQVRTGELWTLARVQHEEASPTDAEGGKARFGVALVRHKEGEEADEGGMTGRTMMEIPLDVDPSSAHFNVSPDGSRFLLVIDGNPARLNFIPIREGVTKDDVQVVELGKE